MVISYQLAICRWYSTSINTSTNSPSSRIDAAQMACSQNQRATPHRVLPGPTKSPVRRAFWRCGSCDLPTRCSTCQILGDQIAGPPGCCLERPAQLGFFSANGALGSGSQGQATGFEIWFPGMHHTSIINLWVPCKLGSSSSSRPTCPPTRKVTHYLIT